MTDGPTAPVPNPDGLSLTPADYDRLSALLVETGEDHHDGATLRTRDEAAEPGRRPRRWLSPASGPTADGALAG
ncbi:MAG TPA: hypothetical protein VHN99_06995, partial [Deinococcales bacterium]|nr:hypothetical protein [Deinococcales bacterium]